MAPIVRTLPLLALLSVASVAGGLALQACSDDPPATRGDRVIDDTRPGPTSTGTGEPPPPEGDGGYPDGFSAAPPDGYAPLEACAACGCSPSAPDAESYCFGGATGRTTAGSCQAAATSGQLEIGCNRIPSECLPNPTCECILNAVVSAESFPCYLVCAKNVSTGGFTVYCPNP